MNGGRCHRRNWIRRGPSSSPLDGSSQAETLTLASAVDLAAQTYKSLSDCSPFDAPDAAARPTNLLFLLAASLTKPPDHRRKHKKAPPDAAHKKSSAAPTRLTVWDAKEGYFQPLTPADIDLLSRKVPSLLDYRFTVPVCGPYLFVSSPELSLNTRQHKVEDAGLDQLLRLPYPNAKAL